MKKIISLSLVVVMAFTMSITAFGAAPSIIEPMWNNIDSIQCGFNFDGENSNAYSRIIGKVGTTKIEATLKVYENNGTSWVYLGESTQTVNGDYMVITTDFTGYQGQSYKSIVVIHVTNSDGVVESTQRATIGFYN